MSFVISLMYLLKSVANGNIFNFIIELSYFDPKHNINISGFPAKIVHHKGVALGHFKFCIS